jgi:hypothetical protein
LGSVAADFEVERSSSVWIAVGFGGETFRHIKFSSLEVISHQKSNILEGEFFIGFDV